MQWILYSIAAIVILFTGLIIFSPISPVAWNAPDLKKAEFKCDKTHADFTLKPEAFITDLPGTADGLTVTRDGRLFAALKSGHIVEINRDTGTWKVVSKVPNARFLGITVSPNGTTLYATDQETSSLYQFDISSENYPVKAKLLTGHFEGKKLLWTNDVISTDDGVYFTITSAKRHFSKFRQELLEHTRNGMILHYNTESGKTTKVFDKLHTANGVNIAPDTSILVAETSAYQVRRINFKKGTADQVVSNLPGLPGNLIRSDRDGIYWLTMVAPRVPIIDRLAPYPTVRRLLAWLPESLQPQPKLMPCAIELDLTGKTAKGRTFRFEGSTPFPTVASALEYDGVLYLSPDANPKPGESKHDRRLFRVRLNK